MPTGTAASVISLKPIWYGSSGSAAAISGVAAGPSAPVISSEAGSSGSKWNSILTSLPTASAVTAHQQELDAKLRSQLAKVQVNLHAPSRQLSRVPIRHAGSAHPVHQQVGISDPVGLEQADVLSERAHAA